MSKRKEDLKVDRNKTMAASLLAGGPEWVSIMFMVSGAGLIACSCH